MDTFLACKSYNDTRSCYLIQDLEIATRSATILRNLAGEQIITVSADFLSDQLVASYPGPKKAPGIYCLCMHRHPTLLWGIGNYSNLVCVSWLYIIETHGSLHPSWKWWRSVLGKLCLDKPCCMPCAILGTYSKPLSKVVYPVNRTFLQSDDPLRQDCCNFSEKKKNFAGPPEMKTTKYVDITNGRYASAQTNSEKKYPCWSYAPHQKYCKFIVGLEDSHKVRLAEK